MSYYRYLKRAGVEKTDGSFHAFRRAFARGYVRNDGNLFYLMKALGHTTLTMSKKYVEVEVQDRDSEEIAFHSCRSELVVIESVTNHGKSTFLRNASFLLAAGRPFLPFIHEGKSRKVYLLNFEGSGGRFRDDMKLMAESLPDEEMRLVNENLFLAHRPLIDGESLTLSLPQHLKQIEDDARKHNADIIIVDTASAGFVLIN
jgi:hypothetical protein